MKIDRSRFFTLTASIGVATASCGAQDRTGPRIEIPAPATPHPDAELVVPPMDAGTSLYATRHEETQAAPPAACPENRIGTIAACDAWKVDPTCESGGPRSECTSLLDFGHPSADGEPEGFQPRVAEEIAKCMTAPAPRWARAAHSSTSRSTNRGPATGGQGNSARVSSGRAPNLLFE